MRVNRRRSRDRRPSVRPAIHGSSTLLKRRRDLVGRELAAQELSLDFDFRPAGIDSSDARECEFPRDAARLHGMPQLPAGAHAPVERKLNRCGLEARSQSPALPSFLNRANHL